MGTKNPLRKKITTTKSINASIKKGGEETPVKEFEEKTATTSNNTITVAVVVTKKHG